MTTKISALEKGGGSLLYQKLHVEWRMLTNNRTKVFCTPCS